MRELGIEEKINKELEERVDEPLLIFGFDNLRYLTGSALPFVNDLDRERSAVLLCAGEEPVLFSPLRLRDSMRGEGRIRAVRSYDSARGETVEELIACVMKEKGLEAKRCGISKSRIPLGLYNRIKERLPRLELYCADSLIRKWRMEKTEPEQSLLEEVARKTDHALAAAAHHVMVYASRPEKGLSEIIRVHCLERGLDMTGYESLAIGASGVHATVPWPEAPFFGVGLGKLLAEGELVRMEVRTNLDAYWSDAARLLTMGPPGDEQGRVYAQLNTLRGELLRLLRPGASCATVADRLEQISEAKGIDIVGEVGLGHGVGVCPVEAPFIHSSDPTEIKEGMVLVLTPTLRGPENELVRSYDTVIVEEEGARRVGWYKDWSQPYQSVRSYQHGGG